MTVHTSRLEFFHELGLQDFDCKAFWHSNRDVSSLLERAVDGAAYTLENTLMRTLGRWIKLSSIPED